MAKPLLLDPAAVGRKLEKQYRNHCKRWLVGEGSWPLSIPLGLPTESQAAQDMNAVQQWQSQWRQWQGSAELVWIERRWPSLGKQILPERLLIYSADDLVQWIGQSSRWQRATQRYQHWCGRWPRLAENLSCHFDLLADADELDFSRLEQVLVWLLENPNSNLYIRQLPIRGIDSKWLEKRKRLVLELLSTTRGDSADAEKEFYAITGIRREPVLIRMRILDQQLCKQFADLCDISAPVTEWRKIELNAQRVFIVENQQTGLAFNDVEGAVVVMGLGYGVNLLSDIPWLKQARCFYWGDVDRDGFAILNRARSYLPNIESLLMDEQTLLDHAALWGRDNQIKNRMELNSLNEPEQQLYLKLVNNKLGDCVRLEQERVDWQYAWSRIQELQKR